MTSKKNSAIISAVLLCAMFIFTPAAQAAVPSYLPYPSDNSVVINPYGETDEAAQLINALQPVYRIISGRGFIVEEMAGRGGAGAWGALTDKEGDGYTLAVTNLQSLILRTMTARPVFNLDEINTINILAEAPMVLWVPENSPFPSLEELLRSARAYPNQMIVSGAGSSTQTHLLTQRLNFLAGIKTIYLPYIGTTTAMESAKMGQAHAAWGPPMHEYGKKMGMRALAVTSEQRLPGMPDVPTFEEYSVGLFETSHFCLALPSSTPPGTTTAVAAYFNNVISDKAFQEAVINLGFTPKTMEMPEISELVKSEAERLSALLEQFSID